MSDPLLPTPRSEPASYYAEDVEKQAKREEIHGKGRFSNLSDRVNRLLPTPNANDAGSHANRTAGRSDPDSKHHDGVTLTDWLRLTSACSQGSEDSTSPSKPSDSDASDRSSGTSPAQQSSLDIGPTFPSSTIASRWTTRGSQASMPSSRGGLASRTHTGGSDGGVPMPERDGLPSPVLFARLDADSSWVRTSEAYEPLRLDGTSEPYSETWPRSGSMRDGRVYEHPMSVLPTGGSGSSYSLNVPTPTSSDSVWADRGHSRRGIVGNHNLGLVDWARSLGDLTDSPSEGGSE